MGVVVRLADRPGDLGWMVWQHGEVYAATLGWDTSFEALVARIVADYAAAPPDPRLGGWIAELDGRRVGCVLCVPAPDSPDTAVLRILLVTPDARGHGAGAALVAACVDHARAAGCTGDDALDQRRPRLGPPDLRGRRLRAGRLRGAPLVRAGPGRPDTGGWTL